MAARIDAQADALTRTTDLPAATPLTVCMRVYLVSDRNAAGFFFQLVNAAGTVSQDMRVTTDGTTFRVQTNATGSSSSTSLTIAQWYHVAYVRDGTSHTIYLDGTQAATVTSSISLTPAGLLIGSNTVTL